MIRTRIAPYGRKALPVAAAVSAFVLLRAWGEVVPDDGPLWALYGLATFGVFLVTATAAGSFVSRRLRPFRHSLWGRLLTAYLLLLIVYGGVAVILMPVIDETPSLATLAGFALFLLPMAPFCVWYCDRWPHLPPWV